MKGSRKYLPLNLWKMNRRKHIQPFSESSRKRGIEKVWLCISDAHKGLQAAIRKTLHGTSWQRCKVHFMRNILAHVPQKDKEKVAAKLKLIWKAPDEKSARAMKAVFCQEYEKLFPKAVECLEEGFENSIQF